MNTESILWDTVIITWDNNWISRSVMLWISPTGCCARITIDCNIIFWVRINWNNADWLNIFGKDKFFDLNCNPINYAIHCDQWKQNPWWSRVLDFVSSKQLIGKTYHFNKSIIVIDSSCVVLWMSIEFLDSCEIVIAFPDVCSKNYVYSFESSVHFWDRLLLRPSTFTLTYNNLCDSPVSNDDSAWIWFTMSCWDNIFWWTNWTTAHVTSWDIWKNIIPDWISNRTNHSMTSVWKPT